MRPLVAIVGRPNVGKSMLFNKLTGQRLSIVEDTPGVTRDRLYAPCEWLGRRFDLVDTGGIEPRTDDEILLFMRTQAEIAIQNATVIIFLCDIKTGLTASDQEVANMLLKSGKPVVLAVNKMDQTGPTNPDIYEFYNLGLGDPVAVSAVHGHGTGDLLDECLKYFPPEDDEEEDPDLIKVAIIGKPNVGKSSLVNRILGEERVIVSNMAGTTRDAVDSYFENEKGKYLLIDTAGMRKNPKWTTGWRSFLSSGAPWPSSGATCASSSSTPTRGSPSRTPRWPGWPTMRGRPASSWSTSGTRWKRTIRPWTGCARTSAVT